ncbi:S1C family serine protease [Zhihengliuella halotolerans]|uniref:Putative serine protease PepD n=1 Tax=Zhihengliuella halotolerans TaxID=370736 RepID=A0A4Q8AAC3_9MICC|nr:trypsin-like peptidase domain-containing protein [Zhihengliuella halotolerans]RZU61057.1 putative serine protease PepD [Zhihengliuella halotolerans]
MSETNGSETPKHDARNPASPEAGQGAVPPRPQTPPTGATGPDEPASQPSTEPETTPITRPDAAATAAQPAVEQPTTEQPAMTEQPAAAEEPAERPRYGQLGPAAGADAGPRTQSDADTAGAAGQPAAYSSAYQYGQSGDGHTFYGAPVPAPRSQRRPRRYGAATLVGGMLLAAIVGAGSAIGANYFLTSGSSSQVSSQQPGESLVINNPENVTAVSAAAAKASPSVVTIEASSSSAGGSGSGIILDDDGHILTNTHVVTLGGETGDPSLSVRTADGQVHQAQIVGTDPLSDLAVIKIDAENLTPAELGSSGDLNVGDTAVAIGAPLGLSGTVTDGIISTLNRTISIQSSAVPDAPAEGEEDGGGGEFNFQFPGQEGRSGNSGSIHVNVIQTDAAINHGNSGGALVNVDGEIIGVNVAIASSGNGATSGEDSGSIGVGFAIPIDYAQRIAADLIADGEASHGLLGVTVQAQPAGTGENASSFSVGAVVREVSDGSPAEEAGLRQGDVITRVDERRIDDSLSLTAVIREYAAGDKATIHYLRDGREATADVTVDASPSN